MLKEIMEINGEKSHTFQVMLLKNDLSDEVEIHETGRVDFLRIHAHLSDGGSVFITSKPSQKQAMPKFKAKKTPRRKPLKTVTAFYFDHV
jgi:hypothetical protein